VPGSATVVRAVERTLPSWIVEELGLPADGPVLVVLGGAAGMSSDDVAACEPLFELIATVASETGATSLDGGTDVGVMRLMGRARAARDPAFPLVGVAAEGTVRLDGASPDPQRVVLEPHHSHFALVPGNEFGDESPWLASIAAELAGDLAFPALMINGGALALLDANNVVRAGGFVVAIRGTGRLADRLASSATTGDGSGDIAALVESGRLVVEDRNDDRLADALRTTLRERRGSWTR
jgi:hypothetical protein